jgi:hypothetical protein
MNSIGSRMLAGPHDPFDQFNYISPLDLSEVAVLPLWQNVLLEVAIILGRRPRPLMPEGMFGHVTACEGLEITPRCLTPFLALLVYWIDTIGDLSP